MKYYQYFEYYKYYKYSPEITHDITILPPTLHRPGTTQVRGRGRPIMDCTKSENISIRKYFNDLHCRRGREPQMIDKLEKAITAIGNYNKRSISQNIEFINSSSSGADSERGHGGSVRDRWDGRRDLFRHSCLQTIRRLHRAAHDVLLEDAYYFLHDTNIDDDITFPR